MPSKTTGTKSGPRKLKPKYDPFAIPEPFKKTEYHSLKKVYERFKKSRSFGNCLEVGQFAAFTYWLNNNYRFEKK